MSKPDGGRNRSSSRNRTRSGKSAANTAGDRIPRDLASLIRGLYGRVARQLCVDPSYVSRVARGERQSKKIVSALRRELNRIVRFAHVRHQSGRKAAGKKVGRKK